MSIPARGTPIIRPVRISRRSHGETSLGSISGIGRSTLGRPLPPAVGELLALVTSCAPFAAGMSTDRLKINRCSPTSRCELSSSSIEAEPRISPSTRIGKRDGRRRIVVRPSPLTRISAVGGNAASTDNSTLPSPRPPRRLAPKRSSQYSLSNERYGIQGPEQERARSHRDNDHTCITRGTRHCRSRRRHTRDELARSTCRAKCTRTFGPSVAGLGRLRRQPIDQQRRALRLYGQHPEIRRLLRRVIVPP